MDNVKEFKQQWINILNEEIDTYVLQVESLREFLRHIGYEFYYQDKNDTWHIKKYYKRTPEGFIMLPNAFHMSNPEFLSLDQAVGLHNGTVGLKTNGKIVEEDSIGLTLTWGDVTEAHKQQLVHTVYLQRDKGEWKVQKNQVRFVKDVFSSNEEIKSTY